MTDTLAARLHKLRKDAGGLSQRELAHLGACSPSYPGHIEAGRVTSVHTVIISRVAKVLGCSLDWLVDGVGEPPEPEAVQLAVEQARVARAKALAEAKERAATEEAETDPAPMGTGTGGP